MALQPATLQQVPGVVADAHPPRRGVRRPRRRPGVADVSDLSKNVVVKWQHKNYLALIIFMGFVFPTLVAWIGWGDARGGYIYAGVEFGEQCCA